MGFWKDVGSFLGGAAGGNIIGAGIGALGSIIGSKSTNDANLGMMREQMAWNTKEREASQSYNTRERVSSQEWQDQQRRLQNNWARDMYEAYQTPQALAEQYKAAGLNPRLAMGSNSVGSVSASSGSTGGAPSGTHVSPMGVNVPFMSSQGYTQAFASMAESLKSLGEAQKLGIDISFAKEQWQESIKGMKLENIAKELSNNVNTKYLDSEKSIFLQQSLQQLAKGNIEIKQAHEILQKLRYEKLIDQKTYETFDERFAAEINKLNSEATNNYASANNFNSASRERDTLVPYRRDNLKADTANKWSQKAFNDAQSKVSAATEELLKSQKLTEDQRQKLVEAQSRLESLAYQIQSIEYAVRLSTYQHEISSKNAEYDKLEAQYKKEEHMLRVQLTALKDIPVLSELASGLLAALDSLSGATLGKIHF